MAKVILPLGSEEVHGAVGKSLIFQGETVKAFRVPRYRAVEAQRNTNARFASVVKMIRSMGGWGRGVCRNLFGSNWVAKSYKAISSNWHNMSAAYDALSSGEKTDWTNNAKISNIPLSKGKVFYCCAFGIYDYMVENNLYTFDLFGNQGIGASAARDWWDKDLTGVLASGIHVSNVAEISYYLFIPVSGGVPPAFHRMQSQSLDATFDFYFYGSRIGIFYTQYFGAGVATLSLDDGKQWTIPQGGDDFIDDVFWMSEFLGMGLHRLHGVNSGATGNINLRSVKVF